MTEKRPMVILTGPTAVGKTALSIELAKKINGSIISADSMQVYRHMDIGSAKVMPEEMNGVKHYLIDEFEPDEEFHVVKFVERGRSPRLPPNPGLKSRRPRLLTRKTSPSR